MLSHFFSTKRRKEEDEENLCTLLKVFNFLYPHSCFFFGSKHIHAFLIIIYFKVLSNEKSKDLFFGKGGGGGGGWRGLRN